VKLAPAGVSARKLIDDYCGGMADGQQLLAYLPGGAAGGILPASMAELPLHFGELEKHGALVGSAAVIVLSDRDDLRAAVQALLEFFRRRKLRPMHAVPGRHREDAGTVRGA
jgi:NADH:ubiquinone oxidoreductase subunit F (NADH-binding)